jgi:hypothetical protein
MKIKQKGVGCAFKAPIFIDLENEDIVSQVVREVLAEDLIKTKANK